MKRRILVILAWSVLVTLACNILATPTPPAVVARITATPQVTPSLSFATPARPNWWPTELQMPNGAVLTSGGQAPAIWSINNQNADSLKDKLLRQASAAGYQVHIITQSQGTIYDLLFTKGNITYTLNITRGSDATILTGDRTGVVHLVMSGAFNQALDLPLRERLNLTPGSEVSIGTAVPVDTCNECQYYLNIHIAPFNGPGNYTSKSAAVYIIDVELVPGGTEDHDDYRWAKQCSVQIQESSGSFTCSGLENINDNSKIIDITGNWQEPPEPS